MGTKPLEDAESIGWSPLCFWMVNVSGMWSFFHCFFAVPTKHHGESWWIVMPRVKVVKARKNWHGFSRVCHPVPPVSRLGVLEKHLAVLAVAVTMAGLGIPVKLLHEAAGITWAHDPEKQGKVINDTIMIYNYAKCWDNWTNHGSFIDSHCCWFGFKSVVSHWLEIWMRTMIEHSIQVQSKVVRLFFNPGQLGHTRSIAAHYQWYSVPLSARYKLLHGWEIWFV